MPNNLAIVRETEMNTSTIDQKNDHLTADDTKNLTPKHHNKEYQFAFSNFADKALNFGKIITALLMAASLTGAFIVLFFNPIYAVALASSYVYFLANYIMLVRVSKFSIPTK